MAISQELKRFRGRFGYSQADVADKLEMSRQNYAQYEFSNNPVTPKVDFILKLANAFNVSTDYVLGLTDDPRPINQILAEMQNQKNSAEYATKKDIDDLISRLEKFESALEKFGITSD